MPYPSKDREIPYNYTSFSDREIFIRFLGEEGWKINQFLRGNRGTGRSAKMLFEILGDMWIIDRNPYLQDDIYANLKDNLAFNRTRRKRRKALIEPLKNRLAEFKQRIKENEQAQRLLVLAEQAVSKFEAEFKEHYLKRDEVKSRLKKVTRKDNIDFSGLARVSHATDATDWRVEIPFVVVSPDTELETAQIVKICIECGLTIIPRGGGTGYTGSAVPLSKFSAVINTEKLENLSVIENNIQLPECSQSTAIIEAGAGVVTRRISQAAEAQGLAFAVDPTSQDASTIGGNIAMNAGGKKAIIWGTTLDNLASWRMVMPDGGWIEITRINHNLGKIHLQETVIFEIAHLKSDGKTVAKKATEIISIAGQDLRKTGLGKDVTDKFLFAIPGVQKEGCDGLITSARFILHPMPKHALTLCLEFFDTDIARAVPAIVEITDFADAHQTLLMTGLEHLDERYLKAVKYTTKTAGKGRPKMVLLADIVADQLDIVEQAAIKIQKITEKRGGQVHIASSPQARRQFWLDRAKTAAISAHTNAFKINEDVVIPLPRLADYSRGIEQINIIQSITNKNEIFEAVLAFLKTELNQNHQDPYEISAESQTIIYNKQQAAIKLVEKAQKRWLNILKYIDQPAKDHPKLLESSIKFATKDLLIDLLLRRDLTQSWRLEVRDKLAEIFAGQDMAQIRHKIIEIHQEIKNNRLFVALHMHAGDGNVHTNIPVHSHHYQMLHEADKIVDQIMALTLSLDGSISGEHGIGLTKFKYLEADKKAAFTAYKQKVDPNGHFNAGKLLEGSGLAAAYTPSLQLLQQEALILEKSALGDLNNQTKHCLRCGKCKPECQTHIPRANLLYSPRNKILATGLIIEAFLYEEQTKRGIALSHFDEMNDIADHCTVCHKCLNPCPVNIDFGDVTTQMRKILVDRKEKKKNIALWASFAFLNTASPRMVSFLRWLLIKRGYGGLKFGHKVFKYFGLLHRKKKLPISSNKAPKIKVQITEMVRHPIHVDLPKYTMRDLFDIADPSSIPIIRDPDKVGEGTDAVFYFPGCGSEKLYSQVGLAVISKLYAMGEQVILPPSYLCCGYPQNAAGKAELGQQISTDNRVLFHRIANTLNYLKIKTVLVSCGTCIDQLLKYEFEKIFPNCRLLDIHEYLVEKDQRLEADQQQYLYHEPCHPPMKKMQSIQVAKQLTGSAVYLSERCCGEAGTLGINRPDISNQLRFRKTESIKETQQIALKTAPDKEKPKKILTSCPACQQGLARYHKTTGIKTDYIIVEMMEKSYGKNWAKIFQNKIKDNGIEKILL